MGRTGLGDYLALTAGFAVFALVFNSGKDLVYSMAAGSALLALLALILYWPLIRGRLNPSLA
ncbi:MAG: hypothetical protein LRS43_04090, partial [Desulfurococcales archaeon]|nr:hypothetical protein [Desulfurococcales archaeon]